MELSTGVSLIPQSAAQVPVVPFADLANFISDCNPSPVDYMLASGEPFQSTVAQHSHSESWYIVVPSPKKTSNPQDFHQDQSFSLLSSSSGSPPLQLTPSSAHSAAAATLAPAPAAEVSDQGSSPWQLQLQHAKSKQADLLGEPQAMHEKVVSTIIDCAKYTKQNFAPTIWAALYSIYGLAYSAVALAVRCTQMGWAAGVYVMHTFYSVMATMAYWAYAIPKYSFIYASTPFVKAAKLWYRISVYLYNLTVVQLYLIPLAYIALLAGVVGSVVGIVAGATVVAIQYVFPIVKSASTDFVDEFTTQQQLQQQQPKEKSQVTVSVELKKSKKQEKRLLIATGRLVISAKSSPLSSPALTSTTPPDSAEPSRPPSPTYLTPENSQGSIENYTGKHAAYTSDYEDEPVPFPSANTTSKFNKPISKKFSASDLLARNNMSKQNSSTQDSPLYEDEDGYFNYHQNSITSLSDLISAAAATAAAADGASSPTSGSASASLCNSAASTAVTSPLVPLLSPPGERRFKLARTRRESGSPPAVDTSVVTGGVGMVKTLSPQDSDDLSCFEEAVEGDSSETVDDPSPISASASPTSTTVSPTATATKDGSVNVNGISGGDKQVVVLSQKMFKNQFESIAEEEADTDQA